MSASTRNRRTFTALLAAGALAATLGACSSSGGSSSSSASASAASPSAAMSSAAMSTGSSSTAATADQPFGAACAAVPKDGAGSFTGMAKDPVATAASNNPLLSTLVTAVKQAGLVDTLNSAQNITVFAPTNDAFAKLPKADLDALLADKAKLTKVLTYHVSPDRLSPAALPGKHPSLEGADLTAGGSGHDFTVNGNSKVLCGNVQTANATVYIVDTVLMPAS
ncbi:fasciclin domain-containing protein [Kitasatospora sp. NA04385]|uniref:fasciclin domain-containing protein n=1 Tax=Kitasatospora sp. NA04385 TaxID=2742135 RepID=UPI00159142B6|nr:fasciclin domain-containing protein [Kitasatospora sp. NA04385]QKW18175.1 fasciclin domain-containing protein [Kitasatospora sp. NA04385]